MVKTESYSSVSPLTVLLKPVTAVIMMKDIQMSTPVTLNFPNDCSIWLRSVTKKFFKFNPMFNTDTIMRKRFPE